MRKLGQHFLTNASVTAKIVREIDVRPGDAIVEIGPSRGALTLPLVEKCRAAEDVPATLTVIEKDAALADAIGAKAGGGLHVIRGDALRELPKLGAEKRTKVVGNIPYYITGKLLRIVGELEPLPERCVFMVQKEVAERAVAAPPHMNRLAASVQFWADAKIAMTVPRKDFSPPPKVDSAVLTLIRKENKENGVENALYYKAVRAIFAQPRKTIANNLSASLPDTPKSVLEDALVQLGLIGTLRPQDLGVEQVAAIAAALFVGASGGHF